LIGGLLDHRADLVVAAKGGITALLAVEIRSSSPQPVTVLNELFRLIKKQEVLERTNLPTFLTLFKNVIFIKTSVCPNITLVGKSVHILKHSHVQNNVSNKRTVGSS
jgi:hypothetical protein